MILGIDVGYSHTKVWGSKGYFSFRSTIQEDSLDVFGSIRIEYEGQEYTIGENNHNSVYDNEVNKIESLNFRLCLYTAIAKAMKDNNNEDIYLVTGLPGQYYKTQKDELISELTNKKVTITLNDEPKRFTIKAVIAFPQSAGMLLLNPEKLKGDVCVIDIGGFTVDLSYFNNQKLLKLETFDLGVGMNELGDRLVKQIKQEHQVSYDMLKADDLFDTKEIIKDDKVIKIDDIIDKVSKKHLKLIQNKLKGVSEYNFSKRIFTGGGSYRLKKYLDDSIDEDTIYTNAKAFYIIGVNKFE